MLDADYSTDRQEIRNTPGGPVHRAGSSASQDEPGRNRVRLKIRTSGSLGCGV